MLNLLTQISSGLLFPQLNRSFSYGQTRTWKKLTCCWIVYNFYILHGLERLLMETFILKYNKSITKKSDIMMSTKHYIKVCESYHELKYAVRRDKNI